MVSTKFASATFVPRVIFGKQPSTQESFFEELEESALSMNGSHIVQLHVMMISSFEVSHVWFFAEVLTHQFSDV